MQAKMCEYSEEEKEEEKIRWISDRLARSFLNIKGRLIAFSPENAAAAAAAIMTSKDRVSTLTRTA